MKEKHNVVLLPTNNPKGAIFKGPAKFGLGLAPFEGIPQYLYITSLEEIKGGDWIIWQTRSGGKELHKMHSDAGYGIKTWTAYNQEDNSSEVVNWSGLYGKIVATTDPGLHCPGLRREGASCSKNNLCTFPTCGVAKISTDFIQAYIKAYNEGNPITEVMLECERVVMSNNVARDGNYEGHCPVCNMYSHWMGTEDMHCEKCTTLKLRPDGSVIIHPVKEQVFTREDMVNAWNAGDENRRREQALMDYYLSAADWLKENYPNNA